MKCLVINRCFLLIIIIFIAGLFGCVQKPASVSLRGEEFHGKRELDESQEYFLAKDSFGNQQKISDQIMIAEVDGGAYSTKKVTISSVSCPFIMPMVGQVVSQFNKAKAGSEEDEVCVDGILIRGEEGVAVTAAASGKVIYIGKGLRWHGNLVIVEHPGNVITLYSYLRKISVNMEDQLQQGQVVGYAGKINGVMANAAPQICFTIHNNGQSVDPLKYMNCKNNNT